MMPHLRIKTTDQAFSRLNTALERREPVPQSLESVLSVSVVDSTGHEVSVQEMPDAYAVLASMGLFDKIREIERSTGIHVGRLKGSSQLSYVAAQMAYLRILAGFARGNPSLALLDRELLDIELVKRATSHAPTAEISNGFYALIARLDSPADIVKATKHYFKRIGRAPSEEITHRLMKATITRNYDSSLSRVRQLAEIAGIPPDIVRIGLEDYVASAMDQQMDARYVAQFFKEAKSYAKTMLRRPYEVDKALEYLVLNDQPMPKDFLSGFPRFAVMHAITSHHSIVHLGKFYNALKGLVQKGLMTVDQQGFQSAYEHGLSLIAQKLTQPYLGGYTNKDLRLQVNKIDLLSEAMGVPLGVGASKLREQIVENLAYRVVHHVRNTYRTSA